MNRESDDMLHLVRELESHTPAKFAPFVYEAQARGYQLFPLGELRSTEQLERKLYQLVKEGVLNSPQSDGNFESFDRFCEHLLYPSYLDADNNFVIATYAEEWVGLTGFTMNRETLIAKSGLTVVQKAHQGKGVAKALKTFSLAQAQTLGVSLVTTENHVTNAPMLAINRSLGFVSA